MRRPVYGNSLNRRGTVKVEAGRGDTMKTALEPPLRAGQDDVLHALVSVIATTRRHWGLPPPDRSMALPEDLRQAASPGVTDARLRKLARRG
jgi:hypothetical protein